MKPLLRRTLVLYEGIAARRAPLIQKKKAISFIGNNKLRKPLFNNAFVYERGKIYIVLYASYETEILRPGTTKALIYFRCYPPTKTT